jgi:hypothetical protein
LVSRTKLRGIPAHAFSKLFQDCACFLTFHQCQHFAITVAPETLHGNVEVTQTSKRLGWHRARNHIATDHNLVYLCLTNILKNGFERGQVAVDVIERSDPHYKPSSLVTEINSRPFQKLSLGQRRRQGQQPVDRDTLRVCRRTAHNGFAHLESPGGNFADDDPRCLVAGPYAERRRPPIVAVFSQKT